MQDSERKKLIADVQINTLQGLLTVLRRLGVDQTPYSLEDLIRDTEDSIEELREELRNE